MENKTIVVCNLKGLAKCEDGRRIYEIFKQGPDTAVSADRMATYSKETGAICMYVNRECPYGETFKLVKAEKKP